MTTLPLERWIAGAVICLGVAGLSASEAQHSLLTAPPYVLEDPERHVDLVDSAWSPTDRRLYVVAKLSGAPPSLVLLAIEDNGEIQQLDLNDGPELRDVQAITSLQNGGLGIAAVDAEGSTIWATVSPELEITKRFVLGSPHDSRVHLAFEGGAGYRFLLSSSGCDVLFAEVDENGENLGLERHKGVGTLVGRGRSSEGDTVAVVTGEGCGREGSTIFLLGPSGTMLSRMDASSVILSGAVEESGAIMILTSDSALGGDLRLTASVDGLDREVWQRHLGRALSASAPQLAGIRGGGLVVYGRIGAQLVFREYSQGGLVICERTEAIDPGRRVVSDVDVAPWADGVFGLVTEYVADGERVRPQRLRIQRLDLCPRHPGETRRGH